MGADLEVLTKARASGKHETMLRSVDRIQRQIELQARLLGELQQGQSVNLVVMPEWHQMRTVLVKAVEPYPEAKEAVVRALSDVEAPDPALGTRDSLRCRPNPEHGHGSLSCD